MRYFPLYNWSRETTNSTKTLSIQGDKSTGKILSQHSGTSRPPMVGEIISKNNKINS